jgi:hypothetical protein
MKDRLAPAVLAALLPWVMEQAPVPPRLEAGTQVVLRLTMPE